MCAIRSMKEANCSEETKLSKIIRAQRENPELGDVVRIKLEKVTRSNAKGLQTEFELTKRLILRWEQLKVHNGLMCRRKESLKNKEPDFLQVLFSRSKVQEMLAECHGGTLSGHFGLQKTKKQVAKKFYWNH